MLLPERCLNFRQLYARAFMHCWCLCQHSDGHTDTPMVLVVNNKGFGDDGHVV